MHNRNSDLPLKTDDNQKNKDSFIKKSNLEKEDELKKMREKLEEDLCQFRIKLARELIFFQNQIKRIEAIYFDENRQTLKNKFVVALRVLYNETMNDINNQINEISTLIKNDTISVSDFKKQCNSILTSSPVVLMRDHVTPTLKGLKFTSGNKDQDEQSLQNLKIHCEEKCNDNPKWLNFGKAIATLCLTGLSLIAGAVVGFVAGNMSIPVLGSFFALPAACMGAEMGFDASCDLMKLPKGAFKHFLTFKTPNYPTAKTMAKSGINLVNPENKLHNRQLHEDKKMEMLPLKPRLRMA